MANALPSTSDIWNMFLFYMNVSESRMTNPDTQTAWCTSHRTKSKKNPIKMINTDPINKPTVNPDTRDGYVVPASYQTPAVFSLSQIGDRGQTIYVKRLSFEI